VSHSLQAKQMGSAVQDIKQHTHIDTLE